MTCYIYGGFVFIYPEGTGPKEQSMLQNEIKSLQAAGKHRNIMELLVQCTHEGNN